MGTGKWSDDDWKGYAKTKSYASKSTREIFDSTSMKDEMNPHGVTRESCDSDDNPKSTPIILALDVTGSMGRVADAIARTSLNKLINAIYERKPVTDPHVLVAGIGDVESDRAPLQVSQFEADIRVAEQLEKIWLEHGGGGNNYESYALAWWFAAHHTKCDSFKKRGQKGFIFTMGDEWPTPILRANDIKKVFGVGPGQDVNMDEILAETTKEWEVFHLVIEEGSYGDKPMSDDSHSRLPSWPQVIGQHALRVKDHTKIPEIVCSTLQIMAGEDVNKVVDSWDGSTSVVVREATRSLTRTSSAGGVATL